MRLQMICGKVYAAEASLFTWEVVTGFEQELSTAELVRRFSEEFPETNKKGVTPLFWKMLAFNTTEGRRHRYLVALSQENFMTFRKKYNRILPKSISLYGVCDERVRQMDCGGNLRFAAVVRGSLFILVFMDGRLCHWSEERGYGEHKKDLVKQRLLRFDEFLKRDELFSRAKEFEHVEILNEIDGRLWQNAFYRAAKDPFWKRLDLDLAPGVKPHVKRRLALLLCCLVAFSIACLRPWLVRLNGVDESLWVSAPPELEEPPLISATFGRGALAPLLAVSAAQSAVAVTSPSQILCSFPTFKIRGVVAEKGFFAGFENDSSRWIRVGDSLGRYAVQKIERDGVDFVCAGQAVFKRVGE